MVTYSDIQGGWPGNGNIDADPQFIDADGGDDIAGTADDNLRLMYNSPCLDAGDSNTLLSAPMVFDLDGKLRYVDIPSVADTGIGPVTFLDMGAYEFYCNALIGDLNCDGIVNLLDWCIFCQHWLEGI